MRFFEDIKLNNLERFGNKLVTREEVIDFASKYDPQPFHLDDDAAATTHFGRLSASGMHTHCMVSRMVVDNFKSGEGLAGLGSPGIDGLRWIKPVYPGDVLTCESEVIEKRRSATRPEMGIIKTRTCVFNQNGEKVMSVDAVGLVAVRDPSATSDN